MRARLVALASVLALAGNAAADGPVRVIKGQVVDPATETGVVESVSVTVWAEVPHPYAARRGEAIPEEAMVAALTAAPPGLRDILASSLADRCWYVPVGTAATDSSGAFRVTVSGQAETTRAIYVLATSKRGTETLSGGVLKVFVDPPKEHEIELEDSIGIEPLRRLTIHVTKDGLPVAGVAVRVRQEIDEGFTCGTESRPPSIPPREWRYFRQDLEDPADEPHFTVAGATDAAGLAVFSPANPGFHAGDPRGLAEVSVAAPGFARTSRFVPVDGAATVVDVALEPEARVSWVVREAAGAPVAGAAVTLLEHVPAPSPTDGGVDLRPIARTTTGTAGELLLGGLERGVSYIVRVRTRRDDLLDVALPVSASVASLSVELPRAATITAHVQVPAGEDWRRALAAEVADRGAASLGCGLYRRGPSGNWEWLGASSIGYDASRATPPLRIGKLTAGTYQLRAGGAPFAETFTAPITVTDGPAELALPLELGRELYGTVQDAAGKPVEAFVGIVYEGVSIESHRAGPIEEGIFYFHCAPRSGVTLTIDARHFKSVRRALAGEDKDLGKITLEAE